MEINMKDVISGLYRNFLFFDFTYTMSGVLVISSIGYIAYDKNPYLIQILFNNLINLPATILLLVMILFFGLSYYAGIILYDLYYNIIDLFWKKQKSYSYINNELVILMIGERLKENPQKEDILLALDRSSHFQVIGLSFFASSSFSLIILCPFMLNNNNPGEFSVIFIILLLLVVISFTNYIMSKCYVDKKLNELEDVFGITESSVSIVCKQGASQIL